MSRKIDGSRIGELSSEEHVVKCFRQIISLGRPSTTIKVIVSINALVGQ
jgi:hypothetical protein